MFRHFEEELNVIKSQKLYRQRSTVKDKKIFCSNDYLGMAKNEEIVDYVTQHLRKINTIGATGSSLVSGYTEYHEKLEHILSKFKDKEDCIVFASGYCTNIGLLQALGDEKDAFYSDKLNHASIIDGIKLSKASKYIYRHSNMEELFGLLEKTRKNHRRAYIVSDSVFSMEGDIAKLKELVEISKTFEAYLILDEAHASATVGKGIFDFYGLLPEENVILMGTLSKAIGSQGGFVCADKIVIDYLVNKARSYIFSTALGLPMVLSSIRALELITANLNMYTKALRQRTKTILNIVKERGFETKDDCNSPIIPIRIGKEDEATALKDKLLEKNIFIQAIRYPTVPKNKAILRLTSSLSYTEEDMNCLHMALKSL